MFGFTSEDEIRKYKDKLLDISQQLVDLTEKLKQERSHERELSQKLVTLTSKTEDFDHVIEDINDIRNVESEVCGNQFTEVEDPRLRDSATDKLSTIDEELKKDEELFEEDETRIEEIENKEIVIEKDLTETSRRIIKIEALIRDLERKSEEITHKLEADIQD